MKTDLDTLVAVGRDPKAARRMKVTGDPAAAARCFAILSPAAVSP